MTSILRIIFLSKIILLLILIPSCIDHRSDNFEIIIEPDNLPSKHISKAVKVKEFINLEFTEESVIVSPDKVLEHNKNFFVLSKTQNCIKVFDNTGKYIKTIQNKGDGPNTINLITDFQINHNTDKIELLSPRGRVVEYDYSKDNFKLLMTQIGTIVAVSSFCNINEDLIALYTPFEDDLIKIYSRDEDKIVSTFYNPERHGVKINIPSPFQNINNKTYFCDQHKSQIHHLSLDTLHLQIDLDFKNRDIEKSGIDARGFDARTLQLFLKDNNIIFPTYSYLPTQKHYVFTLLDSSLRYLLIFVNKANPEKTHKIDYNITYGLLPSHHEHNGYIIGTIGNQKWAEEIFPNTYPPTNLTESEKIETNPVIVKYEIIL